MDDPGVPTALARIQEQFRLVVEGVSDYAILLLDPHGTIVSWNAGAERIKGYTDEEIVGQHFSRFYTPEDLSHGKPARALEIAEREGHYRDEAWRLRKDGSRFWASVVLNAVRDEQGKLSGFLKITRDLTARRQAEEQRLELIREQAARVEAEKANRMKDEFLAILSHELRTPLNAILGWAHVLRSSARLDEQGDRALATIERNAKIQAQIVSDLLDVSRITAGKVHLNSRRVDLRQPVAAAVDTLRPASAAKQVAVTLDLPPAPAWIWGDADRLQQVAWNLLSNAVKFTPRGGRVAARVSGGPSNVELTVEDSGPGIPADFVPHVFETFRQADSSTSRAHGGLGLGLAIVKHLVELHGGTTSVQSEGGERGARFTVMLPALRAPLPSPIIEEPSTEAPAPRLDGVSVLVVDDHEDTRSLIAAVLGGLGASVATAASADEGIRLLVALRPDVLVSDIEMPGQTGYDLLERVRTLPPSGGGLTPAVALTTYTREQERLRAQMAGFARHVAKPASASQLAAAIAELVE